jgi:hypothetical protein
MHLDFISQFTTDIRHMQGGANPVTDALSRAPVSTLNMPQPLAVDFEALVKAQETDPELKALQTSPSSPLQFASVPHLTSTPGSSATQALALPAPLCQLISAVQFSTPYIHCLTREFEPPSNLSQIVSSGQA